MATENNEAGQETDLTPSAEDSALHEPASTEPAASPDGGEGGEPEGGTAPAATPAPVALDQDTLKNVMLEVVRASQPAAKAEPEPDPFDVSKLTPEELARKFNTWTPPADFMTRLRSEDAATSTAAVMELLNGAVRQAVTMAQFQHRSELHPMTQEVERLRSFYHQRQEADATEAFRKEHPDLVPWEPVVQAIREQFIREIKAGTRQPFSSMKDASKALAEHTRALLKKVPGAAGGTSGAAGAAKPAARPSTVITGGQGGAGAGGSAPKPGRIEKLWA